MDVNAIQRSTIVVFRTTLWGLSRAVTRHKADARGNRNNVGFITLLVLTLVLKPTQRVINSEMSRLTLSDFSAEVGNVFRNVSLEVGRLRFPVGFNSTRTEVANT